MNEARRSDALPDRNCDILWEDGERVFFRRALTNAVGASTSVLGARAIGAPPAAASLERLSHEYGLKDELDCEWAIRPLKITRDGGDIVLELEDPGGNLLQEHIGEPFETGRFLRLASTIARAVDHVHRKVLVQKDLKPVHMIIDESNNSVRLTFDMQSVTPPHLQATYVTDRIRDKIRTRT